MTRMAIGATLCSVILLASPARANYLVTVKLTCYDAQGDSLAKIKRKNADLIGMCIGQPATSPLIEDYAVTYDSDSRELHVLRRCDGAVICDLSNLSECETVGEVGTNSQRACLYDLLDIGPVDAFGSMVCTEKETYSFTSHKYTYKEACVGHFATESEVCAISFKSGRGFDDLGGCIK